MSDTQGEEGSLTLCSINSPSLGQPSLYLISDDDKREPATVELMKGVISGKSNVLIKAKGNKEPSVIIPVEQKTDALLVKTIGNIKQAWGVAINHKDQLIVVAGREGLNEEMACQGKDRKAACEDEIEGKDKEGKFNFKGEKFMVDSTVKQDSGQDGDCILILSLKGEKISSFGPKGECDGEFNMPRGVAVDDEDNIYVVDKVNSRIQKFSPSGKHLASVGKKGDGELEFDWPKSISIHPRTKNVYVTVSEDGMTPQIE